MPSAFPLMSHSATSIAELARVTSPAGAVPPFRIRRSRPIASVSNGSRPTTCSQRPSSVAFSAGATARETYAA